MRRRRISPTVPSKPVPKSASEEGSGVAATVSKVITPVLKPPGYGGSSLKLMVSEVIRLPPMVVGEPASNSKVSGALVGETVNVPVKS